MAEAAEREFYSDASVLVTDRRFVVVRQTYLLETIRAVHARRCRPEAPFPWMLGPELWEYQVGGGGVLLATVGLVGLGSGISRGEWWIALAGLLICLAAAGLMRCAYKLSRAASTYWIVLETDQSEMGTMSSPSEAYIRRIAAALKQALAERRRQEVV